MGIFDVIRRIDRKWRWLLSVGTLSTWGYAIYFGQGWSVAVGLLSGWLFQAQGFGWAGVLIGGLLAWFLVTATQLLVQLRRTKVGVRASAPPIKEAVPVSAPAELSHDQRTFRVALKQFSLTHPEKLTNCAGAVRGVLIAKIKELGDQDYSYALHHAMHFAWSSRSKFAKSIVELASVESETIDVEKLQHALRSFINDYQWEQHSIANLNVLAKVDLKASPAMQKWLAADKDCVAELDKLKVWPEANGVRKITEDRMAMSEVNWTKPVRVNF